MRFGYAAVAIIAVLAVSPALAGEAKPKPNYDKAVRLSAVALPIIYDGQVVNYVFIEGRILLTPSADATEMGDKEPFFRDALVRAAHRPPYLNGKDLNHIDEIKFKAVLFREAVLIAGPGMIKGVMIDSQKPQHNLAPPKPLAPVKPVLPSP
jgi:hypothetical protein